MKNTLRVATLLSLSAATLLASGYRIPEQSLNSTALSAAYVAGANGADASYYNPANMAFMENGAYTETSLTYINLPKINFDGVAPTAFDGNSKKEQFLMPNLHYVSPAVGNWRYGLSITAPGGLSKRWDEAYQMMKAEEFTLKVVEMNPTVSYKFTEQFAVGFGLRAVYSDGVIKMRASLPYTGAIAPITAYDNKMEADSIDFGYNLAMSFKPLENLTMSATYRSKVDLTVEGSANGSITGGPLAGSFSSDAKTKVPLPASLVLATAYTMDKTIVEFAFERTYWSAYDKLDFDFSATAPNLVFGNVTPKDWKDVNAYRIGISHQYNEVLRLMAGFAIDKSPVPDNRVFFELPDSDAKLYSAGFEYKINEKMQFGLAYLFSDKEERTVAQGAGKVNGTFTDAAAHLVTASLKYKF